MATAAVVVTSTVAWLGVGSGTEQGGTEAGAEGAEGASTGEARAGWGAAGVSGRATGGREELGLLGTVLWPGATGLLGRGRFWRQSGSRYSDRSTLRPRLGRGGSQVVWCRYMARKLSPRFFHLNPDEQ